MKKVPDLCRLFEVALVFTFLLILVSFVAPDPPPTTNQIYLLYYAIAGMAGVICVEVFAKDLLQEIKIH
jgi:hypothetical protein